MADDFKKQIEDGLRAARTSIRSGFPRWVVTGHRDPNQFIDSQTGLPIIGISGPAESTECLEAFALGANGEVNVDFRPLLMSVEEIEVAFTTPLIGTLSKKNSLVTSPDGSVVLKLRKEKQRKMHGVANRSNDPILWIELRNSLGKVFPDFALYDGPVDFAVPIES